MLCLFEMKNEHKDYNYILIIINIIIQIFVINLIILKYSIQ